MTTEQTKENKEKRIAAAHSELQALRENIDNDVILSDTMKQMIQLITTQAFELGLIVGLNESGL